MVGTKLERKGNENKREKEELGSLARKQGRYQTRMVTRLPDCSFRLRTEGTTDNSPLFIFQLPSGQIKKQRPQFTAPQWSGQMTLVPALSKKKIYLFMETTSNIRGVGAVSRAHAAHEGSNKLSRDISTRLTATASWHAQRPGRGCFSRYRERSFEVLRPTTCPQQWACWAQCLVSRVGRGATAGEPLVWYLDHSKRR
jgi:hypothetical protein